MKKYINVFVFAADIGVFQIFEKKIFLGFFEKMLERYFLRAFKKVLRLGDD